MKKRKEKWPPWLRNALQGITYWIGHRRCLYRGYSLTEGALVAEICNLIYANVPDELTLRCEVPYSKLLRRGQVPAELKGRPRADLVLIEKENSTLEKLAAKFVIEIKRASASSAKIEEDLIRLAAVRTGQPNLRTFLFLISEAKRPKSFVNTNGLSFRKKHKIPKYNCLYAVRRTWKAAHSFSKLERVQYACLIEVYSEKRGK